MKRIISMIIAAVIFIGVIPRLTASADETGLVLKVESNYGTSAELSWNDAGYDSYLVEKSTDGINWSEAGSYYGSSYYADITPKSIDYYRIKGCRYDYNSYTETYSEPSNTVEVKANIENLYPYTECGNRKITLNWELDSYNEQYIDGFEIYRSRYGSAYQSFKTVDITSFKDKSEYSKSFSVKDNAPSEYGYIVSYEVRPFFICNGEKISAYSSVESLTARGNYTGSGFVTVKTKRKYVKVSFKSLPGNPKYIVKYTKENLVTGKIYKTKKAVTSNNYFKISNTDTKKYGYYITVYPTWNGETFDYAPSYYSHDGFALMNGAPKQKPKKIKVVNTRESKNKTDWTFSLTKKDRKAIKKFFKNKYKGNNPSRAQMAYDALEWINRKVKYDYKYKNGGLTYVDAIFNKKSGQCLQYNGAFAEVLTYLGYEARVIKGYRADSSGKPTISHFWCEVKLNGRWYLCETGNYEKNGYWQYFVSLYRNSRGYMKFGKPAKD